MRRMRPFHQILINNLIQNVTNFTVWFALVFWAFLETRSVFVTGMVGGIYMVMTAGLAIWFGSLVDHHYKKRVMLASSAVSFVLYGVSLAAEAWIPEAAMARVYAGIHFGTGCPALYPLMAEAGGDVIGLDFRVELSSQWRALGDVAVMGNLDPGSLLASREVLQQRAQRVLDQAGGRPGHIFNLGHGLFPSASVDQVKALVDYVHEASARR